MKIEIINLETGEINYYEGSMMVAPNGMVFIKQGKCVVWCSASNVFDARVIEGVGDEGNGGSL